MLAVLQLQLQLSAHKDTQAVCVLAYVHGELGFV